MKTYFIIQCAQTGQYLQPDGTLGADPKTAKASVLEQAMIQFWLTLENKPEFVTVVRLLVAE